MYNYRIEIEYDGGRYDGWQRLGKDASTNTIESRLCEIIARMTGETADMYVGSRTEKGVHALCQTANSSLRRKLRHLILRIILTDICREILRLCLFHRLMKDFTASLMQSPRYMSTDWIQVM